MKRLLASALLICAPALFSADVIGTWKLNTAKSKYTNVPKPKEQTVTYSREGSSVRYTAKGVAESGDPINTSFVYVKDGEDIKATGFPMWDALNLKGGDSAHSEATLKRGGKVVGKVTRDVAADNKTMTLHGTVTTPDGKKGTYHAVYERQ